MIDEAEAKGANAIVAMRFDTSEMGGQWTEICAYGTAVRAHKAVTVCHMWHGRAVRGTIARSTGTSCCRAARAASWSATR